MKSSLKRRVVNSLAESGFWFAGKTKTEAMLFSRTAKQPGCFEQIEIAGKATASDPVWIRIRTSIVPGDATWALMFEDRFLEKRYLKNADQVAQWIHFLQDELQKECRRFSAEVGQPLLDRTSRARCAAMFYFSKAPDASDPAQRLRLIESACSAEDIEAARKSLQLSLLSLPWNPEADFDPVFATYRAAALLIVSNASEAQKIGYFASDADSDCDIELAWCYQILVSLLIGDRGSKQIAE